MISSSFVIVENNTTQNESESAARKVRNGRLWLTVLAWGLTWKYFGSGRWIRRVRGDAMFRLLLSAARVWLAGGN